MINYYIIDSYWSSDDITLTGTNAKKQKPLIFVHGEGRTPIKMKVLKFKEWKLMHQCDNMGIGLPPAYVNEEEDS